MGTFSFSLNFGPEDEAAKAEREAKLREGMKTSNEPEYLLENDRFNPDALTWLLDNKCIEFRHMGYYSFLDDCDVVAPRLSPRQRAWPKHVSIVQGSF